ncbi:MAG TPA: hypothetical protein VFS26_02745 [Solirubrobacterales bacterium]|nr:hypothetical protein [Solirubrobacterales bacterium]
MRLIPRHRQRRRKGPRIAISEAEISADLYYPSRPPELRRGAGGRRFEAR